MRSLSAKTIFATLAALVAVIAIAIAAIAWKSAREHARLREQAGAITGGDAIRGEAMFIQYGCGSCHAIEGVRTATGGVGPPLDNIALRVVVAGRLANTPANMERWIRDPQQVSPGTAMPDLNVSESDARDMTAFLYTRTE